MMSNQVRSVVTNEQPSSNVVAIQDKNIYKKKKKLCLTNELMTGIMEFKRMLVSQKQNKNNGIENVKWRVNDDDQETKRMLRASISSVQEAIVRERTLKSEYVANMTKYAEERRNLDSAKDDHIVSMQLMLADQDLVIGKLRTDIEAAYDAYDTLRRRFYSLYMDQRCGDGGGLARAVAGRLERCCDDAVDNVSRHVEDETAASAVRDIVNSLRAGIRALAADAASAELGSCDAKRSAMDVATRRFANACAADVDYCAAGTRMDSFVALCHAIDSMDVQNRVLADCANELDGQTESLQANLSEVTTEYMTLSARKSDKKGKADILDDFCAVTEQMTVQQTRNLEFSRMLAMDDEQIADELNEIEHLKAKIAKKNNKKQKLLKETNDIKGQLQVFKNQFEELEKRKAFLTEDLISMKQSSSKSELQDVGQRVKHFKQLKIHFNTLNNKKNALKMKLQKQQQVAKTMSQIN